MSKLCQKHIDFDPYCSRNRTGYDQLAPVTTSNASPTAAFVAAMDSWDEAAADAAIVGLVRTAGAHEIFELLCRYGVRDFREIGHKAIYISNSFRTLEAIGWSANERR